MDETPLPANDPVKEQGLPIPGHESGTDPFERPASPEAATVSATIRRGPNDGTNDAADAAIRTEIPVGGTSEDSGLVFSDERYRVIGLHARGGIGQVLLAIDNDLSREVALKEIQPTLADDEASRRRFLLEAEITGRLEHPGVVPVYAIGKSDADRPFYVMRFIRGESLKEAIEAFHQNRRENPKADAYRSLAFRQLLHRFVDVCNTVAYAHSRGVLHRDLKPSNVMLGPYGETLVVDWGLAKVVGRQESDFPGEATLRPHSGSGSSETQAGIAIGTPAYMSPEQAEGRLESIGPATDVYGLGATLYSLLTGKPPVVDVSIDRILSRVRSGTVEPPGSIVPNVPRALAAICMKALSLRPDDRYASPGLIGREIEHWLADEPVLACPESWLSRMARWGRRHRTAMAATGIVLVIATGMLSVGTILLSQANSRILDEQRLANIQRDIANRQRDLARENFDKARDAVNAFLSLVNEDPHLNRPGLEPIRQKLLRSALPYYEDFIRQRADDPTLKLELAEAYRLAGEISGQIDSRGPARDRLGRAIASYDEILGQSPDSKSAAIGLAKALVAIAYFEVFDDDHAKAEMSTSRAIELLEDYAAAYGPDAESGRLLGRAYDLRSINQSLLGDLKSAISLSDKAVDRLETTVQTFPADSPTKRVLARALNNRAATLLLLGRFDDSLVAFERAAVMLRNLLKTEPDEAVATISLARVMTNVARVQIALGRFQEALERSGEVSDLVKKLLASSPDMNETIGLFVDLADRRALALSELGRTKEARVLLSECLGREKEITDKGVLNDDLRETFADAWWTLALIEARQGSFESAEIAFDKAEAYFAELVANNADQTYLSQRSAAREDRIRMRPMPADAESIEKRLRAQREILAEREARLASGTDIESRKTEIARGFVRLAETLMARDGERFDPAPLHRALALIDEVALARPRSLELRRIQSEALRALARHRIRTGKPEEGLKNIEAATKAVEQASAEDPSYTYDLIVTHAAAMEAAGKNHAEAYARHAAGAIQATKKAIESGFDDFPRLRVDPSLATLREVPAFRDLIR